MSGGIKIMQLHDITIEDKRLADLCRKNGIHELRFFGSVVRDDFRPDSDIDVIAVFEPDANPSLLDLAGVQIDLTELLGREVHLHTPDMIHPYFRKRIAQASKRVYAA